MTIFFTVIVDQMKIEIFVMREMIFFMPVEEMMSFMVANHIQKEIVAVLIPFCSQASQVITGYLELQTILLAMSITFRINVITHLMV